MLKDSVSWQLKRWYDDGTDSVDLTDELFYELLYFLDFELKHTKLENGIVIYYLNDLQEGNLNNIEQDIFYNEYDRDFEQSSISREEKEKRKFLYIKEYIVDRLEVYLYDYFVKDWCDEDYL